MVWVRRVFRRRRVRGRSAVATQITHRATRSNEKRILAETEEEALVGLIAKRLATLILVQLLL